MSLRVAIWAAVSSQAQAKEDKVSIDVQIERAREFIQPRGWHETAGPYIVIASRTRWADLTEATEAIPDLALMLNDARANLFDVLVIFDYTRLRALLEPISQILSRSGIQILSISQPIEITSPNKYDPNNADGASITEFTASFLSRAEIAALKRRYRIGMPKRVLVKGLPKGTIPYGYRKPIGRETDRKAIPEQDPVRAAVVVMIKDLFLSGQSLWQIARHLNANNITQARGQTKWTDVGIRRILKNKYYSGQVAFGKTHQVVDPFTGALKVRNNHPSSIQTAKGAHIPLWDEDTAIEIEKQFERRGKKYTGMLAQRLSGLLYCGICGARMWVRYPGGYDHDRKRQWDCSANPSHMRVKNIELLPIVISELTKKLKTVKGIQVPAQRNEDASIETSLKEYQKRKARILEAYEASAITLQEYQTRTEDLNINIARLEKQLKEKENIAHSIKKQSEALQSFAQIIDQLPNYLLEAPAQRVNSHLRAIIQKIIVKSQHVDIQFRTL